MSKKEGSWHLQLLDRCQKGSFWPWYLKRHWLLGFPSNWQQFKVPRETLTRNFSLSFSRYDSGQFWRTTKSMLMQLRCVMPTCRKALACLANAPQQATVVWKGPKLSPTSQSHVWKPPKEKRCAEQQYASNCLKMTEKLPQKGHQKGTKKDLTKNLKRN